MGIISFIIILFTNGSMFGIFLKSSADIPSLAVISALNTFYFSLPLGGLPGVLRTEDFDDFSEVLGEDSSIFFCFC